MHFTLASSRIGLGDSWWKKAATLKTSPFLRMLVVDDENSTQETQHEAVQCSISMHSLSSCNKWNKRKDGKFGWANRLNLRGVLCKIPAPRPTSCTGQLNTRSNPMFFSAKMSPFTDCKLSIERKKLKDGKVREADDCCYSHSDHLL